MEQNATYPVIMAHLVHKEKSVSRRWFKAKLPTADATANGATPRPAPARTAFSFPRPTRTQSLSAVSIITSISALPTRRVPVLEAPDQPPKCDLHQCCPPSASPAPQHVLQRQNSNDCRLLISNTTPQHSCIYTMNSQILSI